MDVKAIIFLAPISVFDERLEGDPGINQLKDSLNLWTAVCKSKLLGKVNFHHPSVARFRTAVTDRN
jgi:guanine nucleotide-binding protein subunit alpha